MNHYIDDSTNEVLGYPKHGARVMTAAEITAHTNPPLTVSGCRTDKLAEMRKECGDHIDAGFECDALGYPCQYHNSMNQQTTMRNATIAGGKIWRNEVFTMHTRAEAQAVFAESISEIERLRTVYANKCIYINDESRTVSEITAVTWSSVE